MHFLIVFYLLAIGLMAILAQMFLPIMFPVFNVLGLGSALVPLVVIYASLELADERGPIIAVVLGFLLDLILHDRLGTSVLVLFSISALIATQARKPESHYWLFRAIFVLVGTFFFFVMTHLLILAETARWHWPFAIWNKIVFASLLNLLLAPFFFYLVERLPRAFGWLPAHEEKGRYRAR